MHVGKEDRGRFIHKRMRRKNSNLRSGQRRL